MTGPNTYLHRLIALRDHGVPLAEQKEREWALNFNLFMDSCGTEGCLLGWWATTEYARADGWTMPSGLPVWNGLKENDAANAYFGEGAYHKLFRSKLSKEQSTADCLAERRARLDKMIAELMEAQRNE